MLSVTVRATAAAVPALPFLLSHRAQVVGASGDLAKKKIFPALFALYYEGTLPQARRRGPRRLEPQPQPCTLFLCAAMRLTPAPPHAARTQNFTIMGFARSKMTQQEFRDMISLTLTCRIDQRRVQAQLCERLQASRLTQLAHTPQGDVRAQARGVHQALLLLRGAVRRGCVV